MPSGEGTVLEVKEISKIYSENAGVRDVSFSSQSGEVLALIGPNGSGKSTLLNIISGILKPDSGQVFLNEMDVKDIKAKKHIGYLPDNITASPHMKTLDLLYMVSDYKYNGGFKDDIEKSIADYKLDAYCGQMFHKLSLGTKKKIGILIAFMGNPDLIILDEPTNGLDTHGIIQLKQSIIEAEQSGSTIIISSHILDFVNTVAKRSLFLKNTRLEKIAEGNADLEEIYKELYL